MAIVRIPDENRTLTGTTEITAFLSEMEIDYERWVCPALSIVMSGEMILASFASEIEELKKRGGYVTADVIDVNDRTPGLDEMLAKFNQEHWHNEDEVRFIVEGRGIFHIHRQDRPVIAIEVEAGDLIRVPAGTWHWFDLCADRRIRAIRLFQDPGGWTPLYTGSGVDQGFQPVCLGQAFVPRVTA